MRIFQAGWNVLHDDVCVYVAERLLKVLAELRCADLELRADVRRLGRVLKQQLDAGTPWRARGALDVLIRLDQPALAMLRSLLDEFPVLPRLTAAGGRALRMSSEFDFISERRQLARRFLFSVTIVVGGGAGQASAIFWVTVFLIHKRPCEEAHGLNQSGTRTLAPYGGITRVRFKGSPTRKFRTELSAIRLPRSVFSE